MRVAARSTGWSAFRRNRLARRSALGLILVTGICVVTLPLTRRWYNRQELTTAVRHAPSSSPVVPLSLDDSAAERSTTSPGFGSKFLYRASSWLGHDDLGRSLLFRILPGFLVSLAIGLGAALVASVFGTLWGAMAALIGGKMDSLMMRFVDVLYGLPYILSVILLKISLTGPLSTLFGGHSQAANLVVMFLAIGGVSWLTMARVVRGQVLSLRGEAYVEAARIAGGGSLYILRRHLLPNLIGPIITFAALVVPQAILQESFLSFLGIGVQQPTPSLGRLAADGVDAVNTFVGYWWLIVYPCGALVLMLCLLNFVGDGLRDAFDPKAKAATLV